MIFKGKKRFVAYLLIMSLLLSFIPAMPGEASEEQYDIPQCEDITAETWANDADNVIEIISENDEQYHYTSITIPAGCTLNIIGARVEASEVTIEDGGSICIFNKAVSSGDSAWVSPGSLAVEDMYADEGARMTLGNRSNVLNLYRENWGIIPVYQRYYNGITEEMLENITDVGDNKTNFNWKCNTFVFENSTGMWVSEDLYVSNTTTVDNYLCLFDGQNLFIDGGVLNCEGLVVESDCMLALSTLYDDELNAHNGQLTVDEGGFIEFESGAMLQIEKNSVVFAQNSWLSYYSFGRFVSDGNGGQTFTTLAQTDIENQNTALQFKYDGSKFVLMEDPDAITADTWTADEDKVIEIKADNSNPVKYSSIVVPEGCSLSIVGANVQVGDLDIQAGGNVTVINNRDEQTKSIISSGSLNVTGEFTYTGGSGMICESNSNLIRCKSGYPYVAVPVYDMTPNDQDEDVLTEITNDSKWEWFEFIYDASEGVNRWMRFDALDNNHYSITYMLDGGINDAANITEISSSDSDFVLKSPKKWDTNLKAGIQIRN